MARLCYVVPEINMIGQHRSLLKQMKDRGIDFTKMKPGDVVALINRKENLLRVMSVLPEKDSFGLLASYRSPHGRVPPEALRFIPEALGGGAFDMSKAIRMGLEKLLGTESTEGNA